jgi:transcriptional regulator with XRE-family HTH domain
VATEVKIVKKLARDIRALRLGLGISQMGLAAEAGLDKGLVGMVERAETNPTIGTLARIAKALNADLIIEMRPKQK